MKKDEDKRKEELEIVTANLPLLARLANGQFMDLLVRPKKDRVKFTTEQYIADCTENIEYWLKADINQYLRYVHGVGEMTLNAVMDQFMLFKQVYQLLEQRIDTVEIEASVERDKKRRDLRTTQADMETYDANRKCLSCFKFMFQYDETNNQRHKKEEVCTCSSSRGIQGQMRTKTADYRKEITKKKKIPKKDPKRYEK